MTNVVQLIKNLMKQDPNLRAELKEEMDSISDSVSFFMKGADGDLRFVGIYSNKFEDRHKQIVSSKAHQRFEKMIDTSGFKPPIVVWHEPKMSDEVYLALWRAFSNNLPVLQKVVDYLYKETMFAKTETITYLNGFSIVVGKVLPGKEKIVEFLSSQKDLGMSHGFIGGGFDDNIIDNYFAFEFTTLPRHRAANLGTLSSFEGIMEKSMDDEKKQFLEGTLGAEFVAELETITASKQAELESMLKFKDDGETMTDTTKATQEVEEAVVETEPVETPVVEEQVTETPAVEPVTMAQMLEFLTPLRDVINKMADDVQELKESKEQDAQLIAAMKDEIGGLKQSDDEKIAAAISPNNFWAVNGYSAARDEKTVVTKDDATVLNTAPVVPDAPKELSPFEALASLPFRSS